MALLKEMDITQMIRTRRFVHLALKHLLDTHKRKEFKTISKLKEIRVVKDSKLQKEINEEEPS